MSVDRIATPRANAVASLAHTGHVSPLGRRPGVGFAAHGQQPGPAARPGPRPLSARQVTAVNAQNARIRREIAQVAAECRREVQHSNSRLQRRAAALAFNQIDFDRRATGRDATTEVVQVPGTYRQMDVTRYAAGGLWIYTTTLHDGWGDHQYFVFNPDTGALLHFAPEAARRGAQHTYASKRAQIQGTAAGTGMVGGYLEKGFLGTSVLFLTGGLAAEVGAYAFVAEEVAPVVSRIAVQAYRVARPAVEAYAKRAAKGALMRMGVDFGFQFGTGYLAAESDGKNSKAIQAIRGVNGTSIIAAGAIDAGGLKTKAKFLLALGTATTTNLFTVSAGNDIKYKEYWHTADFSDSHQTREFVRNVILGVLFDQSKEHGSEWVAKRVAGKAEEWASRASGKASQAVLRWVTETRVALPASFVIGGVPEVVKKKWESAQELKDEQEVARKVKSQPLRPASSAHHNAQ